MDLMYREEEVRKRAMSSAYPNRASRLLISRRGAIYSMESIGEAGKHCGSPQSRSSEGPIYSFRRISTRLSEAKDHATYLYAYAGQA